MNYIVLFGVVSSIVNMFINRENDPAFWAWLSSAAWASALLITEFTKNK